MSTTSRFSGAKFKEARLRAGLTQDQVAHKMGITNVAVNKWERRSRKPTADRIPQLAAALGCGVNDLYDFIEVRGDDA